MSHGDKPHMPMRWRLLPVATLMSAGGKQVMRGDPVPPLLSRPGCCCCCCCCCCWEPLLRLLLGGLLSPPSPATAAAVPAAAGDVLARCRLLLLLVRTPPGGVMLLLLGPAPPAGPLLLPAPPRSSPDRSWLLLEALLRWWASRWALLLLRQGDMSEEGEDRWGAGEEEGAVGRAGEGKEACTEH
jgi:hypothetical protein